MQRRLWHQLERDLLLLVVGKAVPCECDRSDLQHGCECVCCLSQLPQLPAGPPLSDRTAAAGKVLFRALAVQRGGKQQERGNFTKSRSWHWRGSRRSCVSSHPTLCHRVDESFCSYPIMPGMLFATWAISAICRSWCRSANGLADGTLFLGVGVFGF